MSKYTIHITSLFHTLVNDLKQERYRQLSIPVKSLPVLPLALVRLNRIDHDFEVQSITNTAQSHVTVNVKFILDSRLLAYRHFRYFPPPEIPLAYTTTAREPCPIYLPHSSGSGKSLSPPKVGALGSGKRADRLMCLLQILRNGRTKIYRDFVYIFTLPFLNNVVTNLCWFCDCCWFHNVCIRLVPVLRFTPLMTG